MAGQMRLNRSIGIIVGLGIATGLVVWIPLAWLDLVPKTDSLSVSTVITKRPRLSKDVADGTRESGSDSHIGLNLGRQLAGGGLPIPGIESSRNGNQPAALADLEELSREPTQESASSSKKRSRNKSRARPSSAELPATVVRVGPEGALPTAKNVESSLELRQPEPVSVATFDEPIADTSDDQRDTIELMHELNDADSLLAQTAEHKLVQRGFTSEHIRLARQLTSPHASERAALAARLPGVAGIDARLWLTWMLRDESTDVRLAAISVLATTGDLDTLRRVMEIARQDRDPRIRQNVEQIEKQRRGKQ